MTNQRSHRRFFRSRVLLAIAAFGAVGGLAGAAEARICTRLPLSDVAFGQEAATNAAREKLATFAVEKLKQRGWTGKGRVAPSNETVSCKVYLSLGPFGTEYQCLVTATFCATN